MAKRQNFPKSVQRAALDRAGGICECVGVLYGLKPNTRCTRKLNKGLHFEHILANSNGGKPTLDNCAAACPQCNLFKARKHDTPRAAKTLRLQDKARGIKKTKTPFLVRPKPLPAVHIGSKQETAHRANMAAKGKRIVPRRFT